MNVPTITGRAAAEVYGRAMEITDQAAADAYFEALVARHLAESPGDTRARAEGVGVLEAADVGKVVIVVDGVGDAVALAPVVGVVEATMGSRGAGIVGA